MANLIYGTNPSSYSGFTTLNGYYGVGVWTDGGYDQIEGYVGASKGQPAGLVAEWTLAVSSDITQMVIVSQPFPDRTWTMNLYYGGAWNEVANQSSYTSSESRGSANAVAYIKDGSWRDVTKAKFTVNMASTGVNIASMVEAEVFGAAASHSTHAVIF